MINFGPNDMMKNFLFSVSLLVLCSQPVIAVEPASNADLAINHEAREKDMQMRARLQQKIDQLTDDEQSKARMIREVKHRIALCKACHGEDGNAIAEYAPSLAGQNPVYLVDQFLRFGDGPSLSGLMQRLAISPCFP